MCILGKLPVLLLKLPVLLLKLDAHPVETPRNLFSGRLGRGARARQKVQDFGGFFSKKHKLFNIWTGKSGRFFLFGAFFGGGRAGRGEGNPARSGDFRRSGGGVGREERRGATKGEGDGKCSGKKIPRGAGMLSGKAGLMERVRAKKSPQGRGCSTGRRESSFNPHEGSMMSWARGQERWFGGSSSGEICEAGRALRAFRRVCFRGLRGG